MYSFHKRVSPREMYHANATNTMTVHSNRNGNLTCFINVSNFHQAKPLFYVINKAWAFIFHNFETILNLFDINRYLHILCVICTSMAITTFWNFIRQSNSIDRSIREENIYVEKDNWLTQFGWFSIASCKSQLTYQIDWQSLWVKSIISLSGAHAKSEDLKNLNCEIWGWWKIKRWIS